MSKTYSIEFSPLYRMRNRRKLARVLKLDEKYFKQNHTYKYNLFRNQNLMVRNSEFHGPGKRIKKYSKKNL